MNIPTQSSFLALGDSYTIGEGVLPHERWPVQLAAALRLLGQPIADPLIIAQTGWTTSELAAGITAAQPQGPFDLVSLLIGVNNQYRDLDLQAYRQEFRALLNQAINFAGGLSDRVLVLSIPDWSVTPFAEGRSRAQVSTHIDAFNHAKRSQTQQAGARFVDITPISRQAAQDISLLAPDGLHPSGKMYAMWVQLVMDTCFTAPLPQKKKHLHGVYPFHLR